MLLKSSMLMFNPVDAMDDIDGEDEESIDLNGSNKNFEALSEKFGEDKVGNNRKKMLKELNTVTTLNARDRVYLARKIAERTDYVDIFLSMSNEDRMEFVAQLLEEGF